MFSVLYDTCLLVSVLQVILVSFLTRHIHLTSGELLTLTWEMCFFPSVPWWHYYWESYFGTVHIRWMHMYIVLVKRVKNHTCMMMPHSDYSTVLHCLIWNMAFILTFWYWVTFSICFHEMVLLIMELKVWFLFQCQTLFKRNE